MTHLRFSPLPFGISPAPHIFTKMASAMATVLRLQEIVIIAYLDDWLVKAKVKRAPHSPVVMHSLFPPAIRLGHKLGKIAHSVRLLGFTVDSQLMTLSLTPERHARIGAAMKYLSKH